MEPIISILTLWSYFSSPLSGFVNKPLSNTPPKIGLIIPDIIICEKIWVVFLDLTIASICWGQLERGVTHIPFPVKETNPSLPSSIEIEVFKKSFGKNYDLATRKFSNAIEQIDKSINHLQKTKDALLSSDNNYRIANNKAQDVTIKKLTKNNPTMAKKFEDNKNE